MNRMHKMLSGYDSLYVNRENADKIYDFSRQNFQRYFEGDQVFFDDTGVALNSGVVEHQADLRKPFGGDLNFYTYDNILTVTQST